MPRLRPREDEFYTLFAQAGANIADAAGVLAELTVPGADRRSVAARMREFEHRGDSITHSILRLLNKSFVTRSTARTSTDSPGAWTTSSMPSTRPRTSSNWRTSATFRMRSSNRSS
ncbi:MAG: hypothetical protein M3140_03275 [Actinomycetota bacterium]|nr:hypothetical protein [Actinomycetota bacterium]